MKVAKTQEARVAIYLEMCRRRGLTPEPAGCHQLWPEVVKRLGVWNGRKPGRVA